MEHTRLVPAPYPRYCVMSNLLVRAASYNPNLCHIALSGMNLYCMIPILSSSLSLKVLELHDCYLSDPDEESPLPVVTTREYQLQQMEQTISRNTTI
jgi:hypothetical protein